MKNKKTPFGIEEKYTQYQNSKFCIIKAGYAESVTFIKGAENGPDKIIEVSDQLELYDWESKTEPYLHGISLLEIDPNKKINYVLKDIEKNVSQCVEDNKLPILLGGEHTVTIGAIRALKEKFSNFTVIQIDAHADLRDEYMGSKYNHACPMRRIIEMDIPCIQLGIRSIAKEEVQAVEQGLNTKIYYCDNASPDLKIIDKIPTGNVYLTIDLDGFDPSIFPDVGTPEPGGLGWFETVNFIKKLIKKRNLIGFDIVELCPKNDENPNSAFAAAKLLYKIMGFYTKYDLQQF